jgi:DNA polymerase II large subunit
MEEKIQKQNTLQKKIMAVDSKDALERVMASHFLPDIIGNARAFSRQTFRCTSCNEIYRRIPLSGKCYKCNKASIILTIHEGSVRKYLKIAQNMARQENLSPYLIQRLDMIEKEIDSVFKNEQEEQKSLFEFA